ncbi:hypothetical protein DLAC_07506 [Tieghemostelium lacteum]|uniref:Fe2OG dioxygenase domain-containing protein n=1 Tax=Tieghemostelium lacteum TaxID=361077 RepID=A0A151ZCX1_TIELA|nr:hypothetical protein DLAC_07506 [Tieghemostelium lacteum]|eukprot:KYQ91724.1 hypothetical protein DLAC_07506 [Tieghemostelium lacteum]
MTDNNNNNNNSTTTNNEAIINVPENRVLTGAGMPTFDFFLEDESIKDVNLLSKPFRKDLNLPDRSKGFLIHNVLSKKECLYYIEESNKRGYKTIEKEFPQEYRNNTRFFGKSQQLSEGLWKRMLPFFQSSDLEGVKPYGFDQSGVWVPVGLDDCFTFGRYEPGGRFKPHFDATYAENPDKRSIYTIQIYLNDDYEGGKTNFYKLENPLDTEKHQLVESVTPRTGSAVIFNHDTLHEGAEVTNGVKYIVRVDMMFIRIDKDQELPESQKLELQKARKLFFEADSAEKDKQDLKMAIQLYVEAQMLLLNYRSIEKTPPPPPRSTATIGSLSDFLLFEILKYSSIKDVGRFICTSKQYSQICKKNQLWKKLYIKNFSYEAYQLEEKSKTNTKPSKTIGGKLNTPKKSPISFNLIKKFMNLSVSKPEYEKNWYLTFQSVEAFLKGRYMMFDFGTEFVKFCDQLGNFRMIPQRASKHQEYSPHYVMSSFDREYWLVGNSAGSNYQVCVKKGELNGEKGEVCNEIIKHVFSSEYSPRKKQNSPVVIAVSPKMFGQQAAAKNGLESIRKSLKTIEFVYFANSGLLALQSHGLVSGTVVMMGMGHTLIVPFINGAQLPQYIEFEISGMTLKEYISDKITLYGSDKQLKSIIRVESLTWNNQLSVSDDYNKDLGTHYDPKVICQKSPEIYFNPQMVKENMKKGLVEATHLLIESYRPKVATSAKDDDRLNLEQFELLQNVVVTGGISTTKNLTERFTRELKEFNNLYTVFHSKDPMNDVLKGALVNSTLTEPYHDNYQKQAI